MKNKTMETTDEILETSQGKVLMAILMEHFCVSLNKSPQSVTDAMNDSGSCFLGSEMYFRQLVYKITKELSNEK